MLSRRPRPPPSNWTRLSRSDASSTSPDTTFVSRRSVPRDASSSQRSTPARLPVVTEPPGEGRAGLRLLHLALGIEEIHRGEGRTPWRPRITNELDQRASRGSATGPSQSATSRVPTSAVVPDENPPPADARRSARDNRTRPIPCGSPHRPPERPPRESPIRQHYSAGWHRPSGRADRDTRIGGTARAAVLTVAAHAEVDGWGNPEDLLKKSSLHRPGCVVLDHRLPLLSGLEVLRIIRKTSSIPAILISAYADVQTAVAAMEMGASTVFEKPVDDNAFLNALERFCFEDAQRTLKRQLCLAIQEEIAKLSEVERSTLEQMQLGLSNKAIARKLSRSVKAIERHRQNVVRKLGCISAMEALQKVQACPLQSHSPLACIKEGCPTGRYINVK